MAKKKTKKVKGVKTEPQIKEVKTKQPRKEIPTLYDNSFAHCISNVTGIPDNIFNNVDYIIQNVGIANWHKPYIDVLRHHAYDMIFFSYGDEPLDFEERPLEDYQFADLPSGKFILLGSDSAFRFKCVVGLMDTELRVRVVYDPEPTRELARIHQLGYFISTFVVPESTVVEAREIDTDEVLAEITDA